MAFDEEKRKIHKEMLQLYVDYVDCISIRSYEEMEKRLKVYVYEEGEPPLVHEGPCKNIYTTEGRFISEMEYSGMRTRNPARAHVFFLAFSVTNMVHFLYRPSNFDRTKIWRFVTDYVSSVASKHPFWNRSTGADHFMLSCHDWVRTIGNRGIETEELELQ